MYAINTTLTAQSTTVYVPSSDWDSPTPSPASECAPSGTKGGGAHSPAGEGVGEAQLRRLEKIALHSAYSTVSYGIVYHLIIWNWMEIPLPSYKLKYFILIILRISHDLQGFLDRMSGPLVQGHCQDYSMGSDLCPRQSAVYSVTPSASSSSPPSMVYRLASFLPSLPLLILLLQL